MAAFTTPLRPRSAMPPTNCSQLAESFFHALGHSDDVGVAFGVHPDGDGHAHVLRRAAPRALVPHAVHEHVGVFAFQRPRAPRVDVGVHPLEFVGEGLRGVFCQALVCRFTVDGCPGYRSIVYRVTVGWFRLVLVVLLLHEGVGPAVGFALEPDHASVVDGAVDDRGGHVRVAEHASPSAELDVRGVDDALGLVRVDHDLEQESAAFFVYGHVAELVDDEEPCLAYGLQFPVEFAFRVGAQEAHDQARGGVEPHRHALPAGLPAQRDGEVGLAGAGRPEHDHVLRTVEESEGFEPAALPVRRHAHVLPVVVIEFLGGGEAGLSGQARAFGRLPGFDLGVHPPVHELHLGRGRGFELVGEHLSGQRQPAGQTHDLVHFPVRGRAAAGRVRHRCVPFAHAHAAFAWVSGRMNLSYACRSGAGTSSGVSPALMRPAMAVRLASSIE